MNAKTLYNGFGFFLIGLEMLKHISGLKNYVESFERLQRFFLGGMTFYYIASWPW